MPVVVLNDWVYGSWRLYGYSLFNDVFFPERSAQEGISAAGNLFRMVRGVLLPSYPFMVEPFLKNLPRFTFWLMPVFSVAAAIGLFTMFARVRFRPFAFGFIALLLLYLLIYRGASNTWAAFETAPDYDAGVLRYWLLALVMLYFFAVYALTKTKETAYRLAIVIGIIATGPISLYETSDGSLLGLKKSVVSYREFGDEVLLPNVPEDALIYASRSDKKISPHRRVATWWNAEELYDPVKTADSMARVYPTGIPIFLYPEPEVDTRVLGELLKTRGLRLERDKITRLYVVKGQ